MHSWAPVRPMNDRTAEPVCIKTLYEYAAQILEAAGIEEARLDAWLLLEYQLHLTRAQFYARPERMVSGQDREAFLKLVRERAKRRPLAQVTGTGWFMGHDFVVSGDVLTPRQDTETLVLAALEYLPPEGDILDLCTGSGCILISVLLEKDRACGMGTDLSLEALRIARENARRHHLEDRIRWLHGDLFSAPLPEGNSFDVIVSNPPYIPAGEIDDLMPEVSVYEPRMALDGGRDGLDFYRRIALQAGAFIRPGGRLLCEIGYDQGQEVSSLFARAGWQDIHVLKDLAGHDRVVSACSPEKQED